MKRKIKECILVMLIFCTFCGTPKAVAWWNLLYPAVSAEEEIQDDGISEQKTKKLRFFIVEWVRSLK